MVSDYTSRLSQVEAEIYDTSLSKHLYDSVTIHPTPLCSSCVCFSLLPIHIQPPSNASPPRRRIHPPRPLLQMAPSIRHQGNQSSPSPSFPHLHISTNRKKPPRTHPSSSPLPPLKSSQTTPPSPPSAPDRPPHPKPSTTTPCAAKGLGHPDRTTHHPTSHFLPCMQAQQVPLSRVNTPYRSEDAAFPRRSVV